MLKSKEDLYECMNNISWSIITNNKDFAAICELCYSKYKLPISKTADILNCKIPCEQANTFELFCVLDCTNQVRKKKVDLTQYFTEEEIKYYSSSEYEETKIKFPLVFKVVQINHDQWIGKISAKELMMMKDAQLINYNENAQRTMHHVVKGNNEILKISINNKAVKEIVDSYKKDRFIPNTITLNIPVDSAADYYYDANKCEFVINAIEHFDITDGYHRYIAMSKMTNLDPDFDYQMELRLVCFDDDKARSFIYQEDQKTKMRKITSNSFNIYSAANIVTEKINESPKCNLQGKILRSNGIIDFSVLAEIIHYFYFKNNKNEDRKEILDVTKDLIESFNILTEENERFLNETYNYKTLLAAMTVFYHYRDTDKNGMYEKVMQTLENVNQSTSRSFRTCRVSKTAINEIERCMEGSS